MLIYARRARRWKRNTVRPDREGVRLLPHIGWRFVARRSQIFNFPVQGFHQRMHQEISDYTTRIDHFTSAERNAENAR